MNITVRKTNLVEGLKKVVAAVGSKERLNILSGVRIEVNNSPAPGAVEDEEFDRIELTATDGTMQIKSIVPCVAAKGGATCLPAKFLQSFAEALPDGNVEIETNDRGTKAKISGGECKYSLTAFEEHNFPVMTGPKTGLEISLRPETLRELLRKVKYAAAGSGESRQVLQGVNVFIGGGRMRMAATDGKRLSMVECPQEIGNAGEQTSVTLPNSVVKELYGLLGWIDGEGEITVRTDERAVRIKGEGFEITAKLYAYTYPNFMKVIPAKTEYTAKVKREAFLEELRRAKAATIASDSHMVKVGFQIGKLILEGAAGEFSKSRTHIGIEYTGQYCEFRINPALVEDVLTAIDDDDVTIGFDGSGKPMVIKCTIPFVAVVMPWRV